MAFFCGTHISENNTPPLVVSRFPGSTPSQLQQRYGHIDVSLSLPRVASAEARGEVAGRGEMETQRTRRRADGCFCAVLHTASKEPHFPFPHSTVACHVNRDNRWLPRSTGSCRHLSAGDRGVRKVKSAKLPSAQFQLLRTRFSRRFSGLFDGRRGSGILFTAH